MRDELFPAFVAVLASSAAALARFVPFVAVQYRRHGTLRAGRVLIGGAVLVYALAVLAYTLLPLPAVTPALCADGGAGVQTHPGQVVRDVLHDRARGEGLLHNAALQQAVFNVALFVPLGAFLRYLRGTRVLTTTVVGLAASLLVELTQWTGVWFAYPCAYRLFDVDDLITNTLGALLGALLAPVLALLPGQHPDSLPGSPRRVTAWRRLLGMGSDWAVGVGMSVALGFVYRVVVVVRGAPSSVGTAVESVVVSVVPALVLLAVLLHSSRSVGEAVVRLRPEGRTNTSSVVLRWLLGIGGYLLLGIASSGLAGLLAVVSAVAVLATRHHRGLAYRVVGWDVVDDRADPVHTLGTPAQPPAEGGRSSTPCEPQPSDDAGRQPMSRSAAGHAGQAAAPTTTSRQSSKDP